MNQLFILHSETPIILPRQIAFSNSDHILLVNPEKPQNDFLLGDSPDFYFIQSLSALVSKAQLPLIIDQAEKYDFNLSKHEIQKLNKEARFRANLEEFHFNQGFHLDAAKPLKVDLKVLKQERGVINLPNKTIEDVIEGINRSIEQNQIKVPRLKRALSFPAPHSPFGVHLDDVLRVI